MATVQLPLIKTCQNCINAKVKCGGGDETLACARSVLQTLLQTSSISYQLISCRCRRLSKECVCSQSSRRTNGTRRDPFRIAHHHSQIIVLALASRMAALIATVNQLWDEGAASKPKVSPTKSSAHGDTFEKASGLWDWQCVFAC